MKKIIACDAHIEIPMQIAKCPICVRQVTVEVDEWEQDDDGTWYASELGTHCSCITEPDFDDDNFDDWFNEHFSMPYVDWLPVEVKVYYWLKHNYRFEMPVRAS